MSKWRRVSSFFAALLLVLTTQTYSAQAATTLIDGLTGTVCDVTNYPVTLNYSVAFTPGSSSTITSIQVAVSTTHTTYNDTLTVNASTGTGTSIDVTSSVLASFAYSSISGPYTGTNNYMIETFVGSFTPVSGTTYWLTFKGTGAGYVCLGSTSNTFAESWSWNTSGSSYFWSWVGRNGNFQTPYHLNARLIGVPASTSTTIALSAGTNKAIYNSPATIAATLGVSGSDGKVTFKANRKKIPGCISVPTISLTATCNWKPNIHGSVQISATLTPTNNSYLQSTSTDLNVLVSPRTSLR